MAPYDETAQSTAPTDHLDRDDRHAVEEARQSAFATLLDLVGEEDKANELFARMVADAFGDQFFPDDGEHAGRVAAMTNTKLDWLGATWRLVRRGK